MSNRYSDWLRQSEADLQHLRHSLDVGDFEWSCFAAHLATEKAIKEVYLKLGMDAWGHTVTTLIGNLPKTVDVPTDALIDFARILDKYYILTRYPNGFDSGAPTDYYTQVEAQNAIMQAEAILEFCRHQINRS